MNFADVRYLYALVPLALLFGIVRVLSSNNYQRRLGLLSAQWKLKPARESFEWFKRLLVLLAVIALVLGLARPRWDFHWSEVKHRGSDIVVVLDLSRSMLATDVKPNRLEKAKRAIRDLLSAVEGDRVGLVLFSGVAFIQCPLTYDKASFDLFLEQVSVDLLPRQGTEIASALELSQKAFDQGSKVGSRAKSVILISDGEDHGENAFGMAQTLAEKGVKIFTLGMGAEGSPIPSDNGSFLRDERGQLVLSRPDLPGLAKIAQSGNGRLISMSENLDDFYRSELKRGDDLQSTREKVWKERHMALSILAFVLLAAEFLISSKRLA